MSLIKTYLHNLQMNNQLEMLSQREQLIEDIESIVDEQFLEMFGWEDVDGYNEQQSKMIKLLCDAVCKNFPTN